MVSIIIAILNSTSSVDATLKSVSAQTYANVEVIVIHSGSADSTVGFCRSRELRFFLQQAGRSEARNYGLERAQGDYVLFLDSDCIIPRTFVSKLVGKAEAESLDCVRLKFAHRARRVARKTVFSLSIVRDIELESQSKPSNLLFLSRRIIGKTRFPVGIDLGEDYVFQEQILRKNPRVGLFADPVLHQFMEEETIRNLVVRSWFYGRRLGRLIQKIGFAQTSFFLIGISVYSPSSRFLIAILAQKRLKIVVATLLYISFKYLSFLLGFMSHEVSVSKKPKRA